MRFLKARSIATRTGVQTAIRFERRLDGVYYSLYADGNCNGVLSADIASGKDTRIDGSFLLTSGAPDVRVAINPGRSGHPARPRDPRRATRSASAAPTSCRSRLWARRRRARSTWPGWAHRGPCASRRAAPACAS